MRNTWMKRLALGALVFACCKHSAPTTATDPSSFGSSETGVSTHASAAAVPIADTPSAELTVPPAMRPDAQLSWCFEQGKRRIRPQNHVAVLERAPFALVVHVRADSRVDL